MLSSLSSVDGIPVAVDVEGVVVELGVALQPDPLVPPGGDVLARVLVQVLAKVGCLVSTLTEIGGKSTLLVV